MLAVKSSSVILCVCIVSTGGSEERGAGPSAVSAMVVEEGEEGAALQEEDMGDAGDDVDGDAGANAG